MSLDDPDLARPIGTSGVAVMSSALVAGARSACSVSRYRESVGGTSERLVRGSAIAGRTAVVPMGVLLVAAQGFGVEFCAWVDDLGGFDECVEFGRDGLGVAW
jgi:hypothetical protein